MQNRFRARMMLALAPAALCWTGCAGGAGSSFPAVAAAGAQAGVASTLAARAARSGTQAQATTYIYACQPYTSDCLVYDANGNLLKTVSKHTDEPLGITADPDGNLYVAREDTEEVAVYSPGMASVSRVLHTGKDVALDVAVHGETVAVADQHAVTVFEPGATKPSRRLTDPDVLQGSGIAFDSKGNCYWSLVSQTSGGRIDEFAGCAGSPQALAITGFPAGLAFDGSDNLYFANDTFDASAGVYKCAGVANCVAVYGQDTNPTFIKFDKGWKDLYVSGMGAPTVTEISIATGSIVQTISQGLSSSNPPFGIAVGPGAR
jgi:DNA-binding beta-propeller fold protein YncE